MFRLKYRRVPLLRRIQRLSSPKRSFGLSSSSHKSRYAQLINKDDPALKDSEFSDAVPLVNATEFSSSSPDTELAGSQQMGKAPATAPSLLNNHTHTKARRKTLRQRLFSSKYRKQLKDKLIPDRKTFWNGVVVGLGANHVVNSPGLLFGLVMK